MRKFTLLMISLLMAKLLLAQSANPFWTDIREDDFSVDGERRIIPEKYRTLELAVDAFKEHLALSPKERTNVKGLIFEMPMPDGSFEQFEIYETSTMAPELAAKYPNLKTYGGQGIDNRAATIKLDFTTLGFHAMVLSPSGTVFIDPYSTGTIAHYISYYTKDHLPSEEKRHFECHTADEPVIIDSEDEIMSTEEKKKVKDVLSADGFRSDDGQFRTYRLAVATTGEYSNAYGGTLEGALSGVLNTLNRVNGIYERDFSVRMELVADNDLLIFLDPATDPFTNGEPGDLIGETPDVINDIIGVSAYDIGHNFNVGGGGLAAVETPCKNNQKARGVSGISGPAGDNFDVRYVAHEMGHQFGARHTFNSVYGENCGDNISSNSAYEPGSGTTIMAYTGLCGPDNVVTSPDDYYHRRSLNQIINYITDEQGDDCPDKFDLDNTPPSVSVEEDNFIIPVSTPFILHASATDAESDSITYCWEQYDLGQHGSPYAPVGNAPMFRTFLPTIDSFRVFPQLEDIVENEVTIGERIPFYERDLTFICTVRDNDAEGGCLDQVEVEIEVIDEAGPFRVSYPNTNIPWVESATHTVSWDVANTDQAPINTELVNIYLSVDGGYNYPHLLASNIANTGVAEIVVPEGVVGETNRVKVEAVDNIYFDISDEDFTILPADTSTYFLFTENNNEALCDGDYAEFYIAPPALGDFSDSLTYILVNLPEVGNIHFENDNDTLSLSPNEGVTIYCESLNELGNGIYGFNVDVASPDTVLTVEFYLSKGGESTPIPGGIADFDGINDYIDAGSFPVIQGSAPRTMEAWADVENENGGLFQAGTYSNFADFGLRKRPNEDEWRLVWGNSSATNFMIPGSSEGWHHYAMSYDGTYIKVYYDGFLALEQPAFLDTPPNSNFFVGGWEDSYLDCKLDELRYWSIALSPEQIRENMHRTLDACTNDLVLYYQFNDEENYGLDVSGGFTGTIEGDTDFDPAVEPVGGGISDAKVETNIGVVNFDSPVVEMDFSDHAGADIVWTKLNLLPHTTAGVDNDHETIEDSYFVLHRYKEGLDNPGNYTADVSITFEEAVFTENDEAYPIRILLYHRAFNATDEEWTLLSNASAVDFDSQMVTFEDLSASGQFLITRTSGPIISVTPVNDLCYSNEAIIPQSSYTVSAIDLVDDLSISPSEGFLISFSEDEDYIDHTDDIELTPDADGIIEPTTIYIRFMPDGTGTYNGVISHNSLGAERMVLINGYAGTGEILAGSSLHLDGNGDRVELPPFNLNDDALTLTAWVKPDGYQNNFAGIIFSRDGSTTAGISLTSDNELRYHWDNGGWWVGTGLIVPPDEWSHIGLTISSTGAVIYLNGTSFISTDFLDIEEFDGQTFIGSDGDGNRFFEGEIDEVQIWGRTLGPSEIQKYMHLTLDGCRRDDLIAYYNFNDDSDNMIADEYGDFNGELVGDAYISESSVPVGPGLADRQTMALGPVNFEGTDLSIVFTSSDDNAVVASHILASPYGNEGLVSEQELLNEQYWITNHWGDDNNFEGDLRFSGIPNLEEIDEETPQAFLLYSRPFNDDEEWELISVADEVDLANNSLIFEDIDQKGQYLLAKDNITSIKKLNSNSWYIFPNPAKDRLNIVIDGISDEAIVEVYNTIGQLQYSYRTQDKRLSIDTHSWLAGIYYIQLNMGEGQLLKRFVKQ